MSTNAIRHRHLHNMPITLALTLMDAAMEAIAVTKGMGAPAGIMYLGMSTIPVTLDQFYKLMDTLKHAGLVRQNGNLYHLTDKGRQWLNSRNGEQSFPEPVADIPTAGAGLPGESYELPIRPPFTDQPSGLGTDQPDQDDPHNH